MNSYFNWLFVNEYGSKIIVHLVESSNTNYLDRDLEEKLICSYINMSFEKIILNEIGSNLIHKVMSYYKEENLLELFDSIIENSILLIMNSNSLKIIKFFIIKFQQHEVYGNDNDNNIRNTKDLNNKGSKSQFQFEIENLRKKFLLILQMNMLSVCQSEEFTYTVIFTIKTWGFDYCYLIKLEILRKYSQLKENKNGCSLLLTLNI